MEIFGQDCYKTDPFGKVLGNLSEDLMNIKENVYLKNYILQIALAIFIHLPELYIYLELAKFYLMIFDIF